ncbi:ImmA/IrrE family metallo-endopeptidase [Sphingorhabdus sp.]|uniref:ImmA/IrrE family metallo-endopeptidase n=1 Tax=Sphingorhabdus sp. TaxID=1902408 RepID=UPI003982FA2C
MPKVNPDILTWSRESAGFDVAEAARAIGLTGTNAVDALTEMEAGERQPSRRQLAEMAKKYRRPLLTFYLEGPPKPGSTTHDFRTIPEQRLGSESLVNALVRDVKARQAIVATALEDAQEAEPLDIVGPMRLQDGPARLADMMMQALGVSREDFRAARSKDDAFRLLRDATERAGVFVILMGNLGTFHTAIDADVFRGFAMADPIAPFIIISENDARAAWPFTLLHELGHVFLGQSGISGYRADLDIERLCDRAAAAFMLRPGELEQLPAGAPIAPLIEAVGEFAQARHLSRKMVAYNLLREGMITANKYQTICAQLDAERAEAAAGRAKGQPNYYVVRGHRVGQGLIQLVNRMVAGGALTSTKAGRVLGVKPTAVGRMTERAA